MPKPKQDEGEPYAPSDWPGVTLEQLQLIACQLCRHRNRVERFASGREPTPVELCGAFLRQVRTAAAPTISRTAAEKYVAKRLPKDQRLNPGELEPFLESKPGKLEKHDQFFWFTVTWHALEAYLLGDDEENQQVPKERYALFTDFRAYFVPERVPTKCPPYFDPNHALLRAPSSQKEALAGFKWLRLRCQTLGGDGIIVISSGDAASPPAHGNDGWRPYMAGLYDLLKYGFKVYFVLPDEETHGMTEISRAKAFLLDYLVSVQTSKLVMDNLFLTELKAGPAVKVPGIHKPLHPTDFLSAAVQFIFVHHRPERRVEGIPAGPDLYMLPTLINAEDSGKIPYSMKARDEIVEHFSAWFETLVKPIAVPISSLPHR